MEHWPQISGFRLVSAETDLTEALDVLAHIVAQANVNPVGDGDFIERYDMPVGSIHKAIPFLARFGIVVDVYGYVHRSTDHEFLPVAGHPDDDECTYRSDGTDATYCGERESWHNSGATAELSRDSQ